MKRLKRIMALVITMAMVLGMMSMTAFAEDPGYKITVTNDNTAMSINGKTYNAYKVFSLTLGNATTDEETGETTYGAYAYSIKNTDWAWATLVDGATTDNTTGRITTKYGIVLIPSAADSTTYVIDGESMTEPNARALADALKAVLPATADGSGEGSEESATITLSDPGYYAVYGVVVPTDPKENPAEEVVAAVALTTTDPEAEVKPKASVPTLEKEITAVTETDGTAVSDAVLDADGQAAVAKIGSKVSYKLESKTPDLTGYETYIFKITDTLTSGLDYDDASLSSLIVKIDGQTIPASTTSEGEGGAQVTTPNYNLVVDGRTFTLTILYNTLKAAGAGKDIVVTYDAIVNSSALTTDYEKNTANLEYSNNPYDEGDGKTNKTPDEETYVIDLNIDVDKVAESAQGDKLSGAEFKLYKAGTEKTYYKWDNNKVTWVATQAAGDTFTTDSTGKLTQQVRGLDKGTYYLEETKAPDGYNVLSAPVEIVISVNEEDDTVTYTATTDGAAATVTNGSVDLTTEQQATAQPVVTTTIVNNAGTELPSTGGIGTTIFYVLGAILVLGAGVVLITRRRMDA